MERQSLQDAIIRKCVHGVPDSGISWDKIPVLLANTVKRHLEDEESSPETSVDMIVSYNDDQKLYEEHGDENPEWWAGFPPSEATRFRVLMSEEWSRSPPAGLTHVMGEIGATRVGLFKNDSLVIETDGEIAYHYVLLHDSPIHHLVESKLTE